MSNDYHDPARKGGSIQTFTGVIFFPLDPRAEEVNLEDVAHALSNKARFTGHTRKLYTTCEHSYRVSKHLESQGASLMNQYIGLHHDDSDAYLPDIPTPLKYMPEFAWFREVEKKVEAVCYEKFGCVVEDYSPIKNSDIVLLLTEKRDLMPAKNGNWKHAYTQEAIPAPYFIEPWRPEEAEARYLDRHFYLQNLLTKERLASAGKRNLETARVKAAEANANEFDFRDGVSRYYKEDPSKRAYVHQPSEEELDYVLGSSRYYPSNK